MRAIINEHEIYFQELTLTSLDGQRYLVISMDDKRVRALRYPRLNTEGYHYE